jgi:hypothetical protein
LVRRWSALKINLRLASTSNPAIRPSLQRLLMTLPALHRFRKPIFAFCAVVIWGLLGVLPTKAESPESKSTAFQWEADDKGLALTQGGQLVLRYEFSSGTKPIVYPIVGPEGTLMTRDYPMKDAPEGGTKDHIHHRSLWLTHGEVNGVDFWLEDAKKAGRIVHDKVESSSVDDNEAKLVTTAKWLTPDDRLVLTEHRTMTVTGSQESREIEFEFDLIAAEEVHFGDTKEGSFGIRVPDSMAVDQKKGGVIVNQHGERDDQAWGKRSSWVDYSGPVNDKVVGVSILEHPSSFGHPCRWHVRTYGLFAANPFGEHHFVGGKPTEGHKLAAGEKLHLHYKLVLHSGGVDVAAMEAKWKAFAAEADAP